MNRLSATIAAAIASGTLATSATAQDNDLIPYRCPEPMSISLSDQWNASKARAKLIGNRGSAARIERGKTYAAFMDTFWQQLETKKESGAIKTVANMLDALGESYAAAYEQNGQAVLDKDVQPILEFHSFHRGLDIDRNGGTVIDITPEILAQTSVSQNPQIQALLKSTPESIIDEGFNIGITFAPNSGGYLVQPVAQNLSANIDLNLESPVEYLLGFDEIGKKPSKSDWHGINLQDHIICSQLG